MEVGSFPTPIRRPKHVPGLAGLALFACFAALALLALSPGTAMSHARATYMRS